MSQPTVPPPPIRDTSDGGPRRVGIEIEFAAIHPRDGAALVRSRFGGDVEQLNPHRFRVAGTEHGAFMIELDARLAHPDENLDLEPLRKLAEE